MDETKTEREEEATVSVSWTLTHISLQEQKLLKC